MNAKPMTPAEKADAIAGAVAAYWDRGPTADVLDFVRHKNSLATIVPAYRASCCLKAERIARKTEWVLTQLLNHIRTTGHLAREFRVSPFDLAAALRASKILKGVDPDAGKTVRRRCRSRRVSDNEIAGRIEECSARLEHAAKLIRRGVMLRRKWERRMKYYLRRRNIAAGTFRGAE